MLTLEQFIAKAKWSPNDGLDSWDNYSGPDMSAWLKGPSRSRDSELMAESNFDVALAMLGGEGKHVEVMRSNHWACGWVEVILVNPKSKRKTKILYEIYKSLEDYPLLDDSDYFEREREEQSSFADSHKDSTAKAFEMHLGMKYSKALVQLAYELQMECQSYYGNGSCINVYDIPNRKPDKRDVEQVLTCLQQYSYHDLKTKKLANQLKTNCEAYIKAMGEL